MTEGSAAARGVFVLNLRIEPLDSMDEIVLRATIGAGAVVSVGGPSRSGG